MRQEKQAPSSYYSKLAAKVVIPGYMEKEIQRLEKIVGAGSLSEAKVDDFITRINILKSIANVSVNADDEEETQVTREDL